VAEPGFDPQRFFDAYPDFADSSETGPSLQRLNARYVALIHANREHLEGARVLDLASHDGRFSFAALQNGASHVVGVELKQRLVDRALQHMDRYRVAPSRYEFVRGDISDVIEQLGLFDVVFCFGILYHLTDHMRLLSEIAVREPRYLILDSHTSQLDGALVEIRDAFGGTPPARGSHIEGHPTKAALESMLTSFGWTFEYFDWHGSGLADSAHQGDYKSGKRVSLLVACNEHRVPSKQRDRAVREVLEKGDDPWDRASAIKEIAPKIGMPPEALRFWVRRAQARN